MNRLRPFTTCIKHVFVFGGLCVCWPPPAGADTPPTRWPGWRGDGSGISTATHVPLYWNVSTNVAWKTALPGEGNSSPVVWGDRVFLTAAEEGGTRRWILCLDAATGDTVWQTAVEATRTTKTYPKTGYAASTPATDGERVYAFFDSPGLVAMDMAGKVQWTLDLGEFKSSYNMTGSPVVHDGTVILCCDHGGESFITAVDGATGTVVWRTARETGAHYSSPILTTVAGQEQIVVNALPVAAYDPLTGAELWRCTGMKSVVSPSCVARDGLVYAASGRNGPIMVIDAGGHGDVTETHVRAHVASGGPYVPSPLVYPYLFVPGDNGDCSFIAPDGRILLTERFRGHYTSSPVAAAGRIYWTTEKGDTYVLDVSGLDADPPAVEVLAVNSIDERVLASPAIVEDRLYLRGDAHLFCIVDGSALIPPTGSDLVSRSLADILALYEQHQGKEGPDIALRLELVESLAASQDPKALPLLDRIVRDDNHWDVSEEAAKVLGRYGEAAVPTLIGLLEWNNWRPYPKIIAAGHLARLKPVVAVPTLAETAHHRDHLVRIAALEALAAVGTAEGANTTLAVSALISALNDGNGVVRRTGVVGLGKLAAQLGDRRDDVVLKLLDLAADGNPLVVQAATEVLTADLGISEDVLRRDEQLYGEQRKDPVATQLAAGPVRATFREGELRYLRIGDKEIIRRVYFAVRDGRWDTVMPTLKDVDISETEGGFEIRFAAHCVNDIADFGWTGRITGLADGTIRFEVKGKSGMDFRSPRIGLNVLYGAESLAGQAYQLVDAEDKLTEGHFPRHVSPGLLAKAYRTLRYTTDEGVTVETSLTKTQFGMEDQRNFGDSSYKAFSGIALSYPNVAKGDSGGQVLTLKVALPQDFSAPSTDTITVRVGEALAGTRIPDLTPTAQRAESKNFRHYNGKPDRFTEAEWIVLDYNPAAHMPDDDTFMENIPCILDQVRSLRAIAEAARFRVDPITIDSPYPRPGPDPRSRGRFAAAWSTRLVKYLALAGVDEAVFKLGEGPADAILEELAKHAGEAVLETDEDPHGPVDVLALDKVLFLVNKTDQPRKVTLTWNGTNAGTWELPPFGVETAPRP